MRLKFDASLLWPRRIVPWPIKQMLQDAGLDPIWKDGETRNIPKEIADLCLERWPQAFHVLKMPERNKARKRPRRNK